MPVKLIVNPRARHVSVRIDPTRREAIATAPTKRHLKHAAQFAAERAGWIAQELSRLPKGVSLAPGSFVPLRGVEHELVSSAGAGLRGSSRDLLPRLVVPAPDPALFEVAAAALLQGSGARGSDRSRRDACGDAGREAGEASR